MLIVQYNSDDIGKIILYLTVIYNFINYLKQNKFNLQINYG